MRDYSNLTSVFDGAAWATGLESVPLPLPPLPSKPSAQQQKLADAEAAFADSDLVKELRERSEQNRDK